LYSDCYSSTVTEYYSATNSLPNHCYYTETSPPIGSNTLVNAYWSVVNFNMPVTGMAAFETDVTDGNVASTDFIFTNLDSQLAVDEILCDYQWAKW